MSLFHSIPLDLITKFTRFSNLQLDFTLFLLITIFAIETLGILMNNPNFSVKLIVYLKNNTIQKVLAVV